MKQFSVWLSVQVSPFGECVLGVSSEGICHLSFMDTVDEEEAEARIRETWPAAQVMRDDGKLAPYFKKLFQRPESFTALPVVVRGTPFQMKVWEALRAIPEGTTATYTEIARQIGSPKAVRAVGSACGRNPIGWIIPCHRVVASNGNLGGYHWSLDRKKAMLAWEAAVGKNEKSR